MLHGDAEVEDSMVGQEDRGKGLVCLRNGVLPSHVLLHRSKEAGKRILGIYLIQSPENLDDRYHLFMQRLQLLSCVSGEGGRKGGGAEVKLHLTIILKITTKLSCYATTTTKPILLYKSFHHYFLRVSSSFVSGGGTYPGRLVMMRLQSSEPVAKSGNLVVTSSSMSETPQSAIFSLVSGLSTSTANTQRPERTAGTH